MERCCHRSFVCRHKQEINGTQHLLHLSYEAMAPAEHDNEAKARVHRDLNERAELTHNYGQPKRAPYATQEHHGHTTAKFLTNCSKEHMDSLQCIERNYQNRSACEPFFQAYKACRKEENQQRLDENEKKAQNGGFSFF